MVRGAAVTVVAMGLSASLLGACGSSGDSSSGSGGSSSQPTAVAFGTSEPSGSSQPTDDPSAPSAAAAAKVAELSAKPEGSGDCGVLAADAGWPTTTISTPAQSDCLITALTDHQATVMTFTGRTGDGGALVTRYAVNADGTVEVTHHTIDAAGKDAPESKTCTPPTPGPWSIALGGSIVDIPSNTAYC